MRVSNSDGFNNPDRYLLRSFSFADNGMNIVMLQRADQNKLENYELEYIKNNIEKFPGLKLEEIEAIYTLASHNRL